ncbi:MAG: hypothetical protein ASARMPREDX12_000934 [Alectoria sarmentosa]|nr:MAG: hypothetical protein ASARMPREDX12_000934 [Alectoria sarmentosa]
MRLPSSDSDSMDDGNKSEDEENKVDEDEGGEDEITVGKAISQQTAQNRAERLSRMMGSHSAPGSRYSSPQRLQRTVVRSPPPSPPPERDWEMRLDLSDIQMERLGSRRTKFGIEDDTDEDDQKDAETSPLKKGKKQAARFYAQAARLVAHHKSSRIPGLFRVHAETSPETASGVQTPVYERDPNHYVPRPKEYREGYLSSLLKLYNEQGAGIALSHIPSGHDAVTRAAHRRDSSTQSLTGSAASGATTPAHTPRTSPARSPTSSGATTPKPKHQKWYYKDSHSQSTGALSDLVSSSTVLAQPTTGSSEASKAIRPKAKHRPLSSQALDTIMGKKKKGHKNDESIRIQVHIAETMQRQEYLIKICRALMTYGAPTHRLEEYMRMSSRVLEIDGQFLYIPGCMIISFDDQSTHTTEVKIVRATQGVNLGKLHDTHEVYKEVVHDTIGVEEASERLDEIIRKKDYYSPWFRVIVYGFASMCVGPFAFGARPIDLPIAFFLGCLLGIMQLILAPRSDLYSNVFEISAAVLTSFFARAFGSIRGGQLFCFSALAQSAIALILPGYTILCGSLELQSRNIVPGSVRMIYAVIYSLFLGFGITIGTAIFGAIDKNATDETVCRTTMPVWFKFIFVPPFTLCLIVINHGRYKQMPIMLVIAFAGYIVNHFSADRFSSNAQIANTLGALTIGVIGNLYSRLRHGLAVAALLPAVFVQVPSGLAAGGSLISGLTSANQLTNKTINGTTTISNATSTLTINVNSDVLNVAYSMIQIAIGITVGLFMSALVVYPFGKTRSGLFSF